jgi:hypothetical protein
MHAAIEAAFTPPARTATVEYNSGFASRGMPWELRCYGSGRSSIGRGVPSYLLNEDRAREIADCWVRTGVSSSDQVARS